MADKTKDADVAIKADDEVKDSGAAAGNAKLVRMTRSEPQTPGGPTEADVHPAEVDGWRSVGWQLAE